MLDYFRPIDWFRYAPVGDYLDEWGEENIIAQYHDQVGPEESEAQRSYDRALCELARLSLRAQEGDKEAAEMLARLAFYSTAAVNRIAQAQPAPFADFSSHQHAWPVIKSKREALSTAERTLFSQLSLGDAAFVELDAGTAKWKMDDAGKIAYRMLNDLHERRRILKAQFRQSQQGNDECRLSARNAAAKRLPEFSDASALQWWNLARTYLLDLCPDPQNVRELNALVTSQSKRKSGGRIKQAILAILKARFLSFARNTCYQT
jgi:hypothetical protein